MDELNLTPRTVDPATLPPLEQVVINANFLIGAMAIQAELNKSPTEQTLPLDKEAYLIASAALHYPAEG